MNRARAGRSVNREKHERTVGMSAGLRRTVRVTRRRTPFLALAIVVVLATATAVSARTTQGSRATAPLAGGQTTTVFRLAQHDPPDPFDPATLSDNRSIELAQNVFDGLTQINEKDLSIASGLASRFTVSRNGQGVHLQATTGNHYQDGRAMTAQDMVYSLNRALNPEVKSQYAFFLSPIKGAQAVADGKAKVVSGVKALDARRLQITLSQPTPYFPALDKTDVALLGCGSKKVLKVRKKKGF